MHEPTASGLAAWADFLVIVTAGGPQTRHLVSREVLDALAPHLLESALERAIGHARLVSDPGLRARALGSLAARRGSADDLLGEVIDALREIENDEERSEAICRLPSGLSPQLRASAQTVAEAIGDADCRLMAEEHLGTVRRLEWEPLFAPLLDGTVGRVRQVRPDLPTRPGTNPEARRLAAVAVMESERDRVVTLRDLAPVLTESQHSSALKLVGDFADETNQTEALNALLPHVPPPLLPDVWTIARGIRDDAVRLPVVTRMAPRLARQSGAPLHAMWCDILQFLSRRHRASLLDGVHALLPAVGALGEQRVMRETALSIEDVGTWWP